MGGGQCRAGEIESGIGGSTSGTMVDFRFATIPRPVLLRKPGGVFVLLRDGERDRVDDVVGYNM